MLLGRSLLGAMLGAAAVALPACGGGGAAIAASESGAGPGPGAVTFAKCMRGHGVPDFPDPGNAAPAGSSISVLGSHLPASTNIKAPAFQSALTTCLKQLRAGHPLPPVTAAQKAAAVKFSECVRAHGVPNFPDPRFPGKRGIALGPPPGSNPDSPAIEHAEQVCGNP